VVTKNAEINFLSAASPGHRDDLQETIGDYSTPSL